MWALTKAWAWTWWMRRESSVQMKSCSPKSFSFRNSCSGLWVNCLPDNISSSSSPVLWFSPEATLKPPYEAFKNADTWAPLPNMMNSDLKEWGLSRYSDADATLVTLLVKPDVAQSVPLNKKNSCYPSTPPPSFSFCGLLWWFYYKEDHNCTNTTFIGALSSSLAAYMKPKLVVIFYCRLGS